MICARQGCERQARGDDFCSVHCCKVAMGVITDAEDKVEKKEARVRRNEIRIEAENVSVNRARHVGPSAKRIRRTSG